MKIFLILGILAAFMSNGFGQDLKTLVADGTVDVPKKYDLEPVVEKLPAKEIVAVQKAALEKEVEFSVNYNAMSSEESSFKKDFELLDAADGFFIYREIRFRAYLYTAYSRKMRRNYQGIVVLRILENRTRFDTVAHYVYAYRGDRYLRALPDINGNVLTELAIFSEPPNKKNVRRLVRIIEFSPNGLLKIGAREIYSLTPQKQRMPSDRTAKRVYTPALVKAIKLYALKDFGKPLEFFEEGSSRQNGMWSVTEKLQPPAVGLDEDKTEYFELIKPVFPKGPGEK